MHHNVVCQCSTYSYRTHFWASQLLWNLQCEDLMRTKKTFSQRTPIEIVQVCVKRFVVTSLCECVWIVLRNHRCFHFYITTYFLYNETQRFKIVSVWVEWFSILLLFWLGQCCCVNIANIYNMSAVGGERKGAPV